MGAFIIAEAGVNHNGSLDLALQLVDAAASAKADAVKFQTFKAEKLVSRHAPKAAYQKANTAAAESQLEMIRKLELSESDHLVVLKRCKERGIMFLSTPFDQESMAFLHSLNLPLFKIGSGEITNLPYLRAIAAYGLPLILSTGMSTLAEVRAALSALEQAGELGHHEGEHHHHRPQPCADQHRGISQRLAHFAAHLLVVFHLCHHVLQRARQQAGFLAAAHHYRHVARQRQRGRPPPIRSCGRAARPLPDPAARRSARAPCPAAPPSG